jgi:hypothetical protein
MRLGCLLTLALSVSPRIILITLWLFTPLVNQAFEGWLWPLLGFVFLPFATVAYVLAWNPVEGLSGGGWVFLAGGLLFDIGTYAVSALAGRASMKAD